MPGRTAAVFLALLPLISPVGTLAFLKVVFFIDDCFFSIIKRGLLADAMVVFAIRNRSKVRSNYVVGFSASQPFRHRATI